MRTAQEHWDSVYRSTPVESTGWYEEEPEPSLRLLARCSLRPDDPILDVGAGASTFIDRLVALGHVRVIATDISPIALESLRERLGPGPAAAVRFIVDDVTHPTRLGELRDIALWHDRALLHFLTQEPDRAAYAETLRSVVRAGGHVILAAFSLAGATRCSGLPVRNYSAEMFASLVGDDFRLLEAQDHVYINPRGQPRPYVYALFQRRLE
jgi:EEF1A lysine methyltransferase 2